MIIVATSKRTRLGRVPGEGEESTPAQGIGVEPTLLTDWGEESTPTQGIGVEPTLLTDWPEAIREDPKYTRVPKAVEEQERRFPPVLRLKVSIAECGISLAGKLTYRNRVWVPSGRNLRARVL